MNKIQVNYTLLIMFFSSVIWFFLSFSGNAMQIENVNEIEKRKHFPNNRVKVRLSVSEDLSGPNPKPCINDYRNVIFDQKNQKKVEPPIGGLKIRENGVYSLSANYSWKGDETIDIPNKPDSTKSYISISGNLKKSWKNHNIPKGHREEGTLHYTGYLEKGDIISVFIFGNTIDKYNHGKFDLLLEKLDSHL